MKQILLLLFTLLSLQAAELDWASDYAQAVDEAKREQKNVMVVITTEYCRWCRRLEATTLTDGEVVRQVHEKYVPVHVTRDVDDYPAELEADRVPMIYMVTPAGEVLHWALGYMEPQQFLTVLKDADFVLKDEDL